MSAILDRFSVRAYLNQPVPRDVIEEILTTAQHAPSGGNLQPWHVYVTVGDDKDAFVKKVQASIHDNPMGELDRSCPDSMEVPAFTGPLFETSAMPRLVSLASENEEQLAVNMMWIGIPALILIFGSIIYTLAPVARVVNGAAGHPTGGARLMAWLTALLGTSAIGGLAYTGYATFEANQFALLVGLLGSGRWFAAAGLLAGGTGLWLVWLTLKARAREALPIGVLIGLLMTGLSGIALAAWLVNWDMLPF